MQLVIAEKPSVAQDIAGVIGAKQKKAGYFEGNGYQVAWCLGHLVQLAAPEAYGEEYRQWSIAKLPILPINFQYTINESTKKQFNLLVELIEKNQNIICATDAGREGQLIFEYVFRMAKKWQEKEVKRLWISSMTDEAILEGFRQLKDNRQYYLLYQAAKCRSEADWLVGMNSTRLFTTLYRHKLTVGRVQTPTRALITTRQQAIAQFKQETYFALNGLFFDVTAQWSRGEIASFKTKAEAAEIKEELLNQSGTVTMLETAEKTEERPLLFDLTELQREANRRYGYTAQETLNSAQCLYEKHKFITYPRTDSRYLTNDMETKLPILLNQIAAVFPSMLSMIQRILTNGINADRRVICNEKVTDHHALIPTGKATEEGLKSLPEKEQRIYELIQIRFLAALDQKAIYEETKLEITMQNGDIFSAKGKCLLQPGWKTIEQTGEKSNDDEAHENISFSKFQFNQTVVLLDVQLLEKKTIPPKLYTEATLLTAMEKASKELDDEQLKNALKEKGLGTPATRAAIIEKLVANGYVERQKKNILATADGMKLIDLLPEKIKSPKMTAEWEKELEEIAAGKKSADDFMNVIQDFVTQMVAECQQMNGTQASSFSSETIKEVIGKCPKCGGNIYENTKSFYCENYKQNPPCKFSLWKENAFFTIRNKQITKTMAKDFLKKGEAKVTGLTAKSGERYNAVFTIDTTGDYLRFKQK